MKKSILITLIYATIVTFGIIYVFIMSPNTLNLEASTVNEQDTLNQLNTLTTQLSTQIDNLNSNIATCEKGINTLEKRISELEANTTSMQCFLVDYYIERLKDPTYVDMYNENTTCYTAAEGLGHIGRAAIPPLINRLNTNDDYERALVLYALSLASQADNVTCLTNGSSINIPLDFDARNHPAQVKVALLWWDTYKSYFI